MSNYLAKNSAAESEGATPKRRRKLWLASGVAGLTGVVSIAAVGIASGAGAVGAKDLAWSTAQVTKDGEQAAEEDRSKEKDREDKRDHDKDKRDHDDKERGKEVPCNSDKLIQAIIYANNNHGGVLELAKDCTYKLTRSDNYGNGLPVIKEHITLKGHDTKIVRDSQADHFRILNVGRGGHLKVKGLTIKGGKTLEHERKGDTPEAVWSLFSNSVEAGKAAEAGKPYLPLLQAEPKGAALKAAQAAKAAKAGSEAKVLSDGNHNDGAGVLVQSGGTAEFEKTHIEHNVSGGVGGGIANFGKTSLHHTTVADNHAFFYGGGIFNAGVLKVSESTVKDNGALIGGGGIANGAVFIFVRDDIEAGTVWVEKTEITANEVLGFGGGLLDIGGDTTVRHSKVTKNFALLAGGGIAAAGKSNLDLKDVKVSYNTTGGAGGGLALALGAIGNVEKSEITDNKAGILGGGVFNALAAVTFRDSEISGNFAGFVAGGIFNILGKVDLYDTKVSHNKSAVFKPGGVFSFRGKVNVDDKSAIKGNDPTNCKGSPDPIENCFG